MATFGEAMLLLGTFIGGTLGAGYLLLKSGGSAIKLVAQSIVDSASILSKGKFVGGPSKAWAEGVALSISAFAPVYKNLSTGGLLQLLTGSGPSTKQMADAITTISQGIVDAGTFFSKDSTIFTGGPTKEWSEGIGAAISSFAPVFDSLNKGGIFGLFKGGVDPESMTKSIVAISNGLVSAGKILGDAKANFTGGPTKEWSDGISGALSAFAPVISSLGTGGVFGFFTGGLKPENMNSAITEISKAIANASLELSKGNYSSSIPGNYIANLSNNIKELIKLTNYLDGSGGFEEKYSGITVKKSSEIARMSNDYNKLATSIGNLGSAIQSLDIERITALKTFTGSIVLMSLMDSSQFESMMDKLESKAKIFVDVINDVTNSTQGTVSIKSAATNKESGPGLQDVINVMNRIDSKLSQISTSNDNISRYVNEIRTPTAGIKKR
jgi:archaellum component FlaC